MANQILKYQNVIVSPIPDTSIAGLNLSMPPTIGDRTITAKKTFPALSKIFDNRENWLAVNTGSRWRYMMPDGFIESYDSTISNDPSIGLVRRAYAADGVPCVQAITLLK